MQDVIEREEMNQYTKSSRQEEPSSKGKQQKGFVVSGAPWDASSTDDFPTIGGAAPSAKVNGSSGFASAWGKK